MKILWFQLIHTLPREWKEAISMHDASLENLLIQEHHPVKKNQILCLTKLNNNELYKMQIIIKYKKPTSQSYFEKIFKNPVRVFQYNLLNNVLFLNKMLY